MSRFTQPFLFGLLSFIFLSFSLSSNTQAQCSPDTINYSGSFDIWTVPTGVTDITIEAHGAAGGYKSGSGGGNGGRGAVITGDFSVTPGDTIKLLVGQRGNGSSTCCGDNGNQSAAGGGGGTFIWVEGTSDTTLMIAAGGGGGAGKQETDTTLANASLTTAGNGAGSNGGAGGTAGTGGALGFNNWSGGGAGWIGNGTTPYGGYTPFDPTYYGSGGTAYNTYSGDGGYGGGGGGGWGGGGGGGYSGGGGGGWSNPAHWGGGGGSYNAGTNQFASWTPTSTGNGMVIISWVQPTEPEISLKGNGLLINSWDITPSITDGTDFGLVANTSVQNQDSKIFNDGYVNLTIGSISVTGSDSSQFSIQNAPSSIAPGDSATFQVVYNATTYGDVEATVNIVNNDCDEDPYVFKIKGRNAPAYCEPTYSQPCLVPYMKSVTLGSISNLLTYCQQPGYSNYTDLSTIAAPGESIAFHIAPQPSNADLQYHFFIDLDKDGYFVSSGESLGTFTDNDGSITIPATASPGAYALRIVSRDGAIPYTACRSYVKGETEDYTVIVPEPCSTTPSPGATQSTLNTVCAESFTLSFDATALGDSSGYNYQWQDSIPGGTWANIAGANEITHTLTQSDTTWYRCQVNCANGGDTVITTPTVVNWHCTPCDPSYVYACQITWINSVTIGNTTNTSNDCGTNGSSDFTSVIEPVEAGDTITVSVTTQAYDLYLSVFLDINNDGTFYDPGEHLASFQTSSFNGSANIAIPSGVSLGNHTLRITSNLTGYSSDPCLTAGYGETENYTLNVTIFQDCSSLPSLGNTLSSADTVCGAENIDLSFDTTPLIGLSGLSYQWQDSTASGTWQDISGATSSTHSITQTTSSWYRCRITCQFGGDVAFSGQRSVLSYCPPCTPTHSNCSLMYINHFSVGALTNYSSGNGCGNTGYSDFSHLSTLVQAGETLAYNIFVGGSYSLNHAIWIDLDGDGLFNGAGELIESNSTNTNSYWDSLTVPANITGGAHKMRVTTEYNGFPIPSDPCGTYSYGETEDYTLIIIDPNCSPTTGTLDTTACVQYTVPSGDETYTVSGTYMDTIYNSVYCDSIITINLTILTVDTGITVSGNTVTANASGAAYQWLDCQSAYAQVSGETGQSLTVTGQGQFAVEVTQNGCVDTSACVYMPQIPATALDFDGANDRVNLGNVLAFDHTDTFTMETWVKGGAPNILFSSLDASIYGIQWTFVTGTTYRPAFYLFQGSGVGLEVYSNEPWPSDGGWHHLAVSYDGSGSATGVTLYIDGQSSTNYINTDNITGTTQSTGNAYLGRNIFGQSYLQSMDEFRVWNDVRSCEEIGALMNCELVGNEAGLVAYYDFNNSAAVTNGNNAGDTVLVDRSPSGFDGVLENFALDGQTSNWILGQSYGSCSGVTVSAGSEIDITGNGASIANGDLSPIPSDSTDFEEVVFNNSSTHTFAIVNSGQEPLIVTNPISITGAGASAFSITQNPDTLVAANGGTTTFDLTFAPTAVTTYNATVEITNSDCNEPLYTFAVAGSGVLPLCTAGPSLGLTQSTLSTVCSESTTLSFDLSAVQDSSGYVYQWQDSISGGSWTDISGATNSSYATTLSDTTWFRCQVSCQYGGSVSYSTPTEVAYYCPPCMPTHTNGCGLLSVSNLDLGTISNASGCGVNSYSDFTSMSTNASEGQVVNFTATLASYNQHISVWLDIDGDGTFYGANEFITTVTSTSFSASGSITIPAGISAGNHAVRFVSEYSGFAAATDPCQTLQYGETEDYTINILVLDPCSVAPSLGATQSSMSTICDETFTLSFDNTALLDSAGYTYQWQDSVPGGTWTDIASATGATHSLTHSDTTWYRCSVTCTNGSATSHTTPVEVAQYCPPCDPTYTNACQYMWITNVTMSSINNTSTFGANGLSDFTSMSFDAEQGSTVNFSFSREAYDLGYHIYMDLNNDGLFNGSGESLWSGFQNGVTTTGSFTIPNNAGVGAHTIRIVSTYNTSPTDPCGTYTYGETEEYTVNVTQSTCVETTHSFYVARCSAYTVPSGNATYTTTGVYNDTIQNSAGCDSVLTISVYIGEVPTITQFTSREHDQFRVRWEYLLPVTVNDTNFRIRVWEKGYPAAYTDKSQFPNDFQKKFTDLEEYTWYDVKVGFACADGSFIWSDIDSVRTKRLGICPTPDGLTQILPLEDHRARVSWNSTGVSHTLRFRLDGSSDWSYRTVADTTKELTGLISGSTYEYQVKLHCSNGLISSYTSLSTFQTSGGAGVDGGAFGRMSADISESIQLFPNPNNGRFTLELPESEMGYTIVILDILGGEIARFNLKAGRTEMDLAEFGPGMYFLRSNERSTGNSQTMRFNIR